MKLSICWVGSFDASFARNQRLQAMLVERGHTVCTIHSGWTLSGDRLEMASRPIRTAFRLFRSLCVLFVRLSRTESPDAFVVGYPGWFDLPVVKAVARLKRVPVIFDPFVSLLDTAIDDRGLWAPTSLAAGVLRTVDRWACQLADCVIVDTPQHGAFLSKVTGVPLDRFRVVPVGAEDSVFAPTPPPSEGVVLFYGSYIPLHGLDVILEAAAMLLDSGYRFVLIGDGQERARIEASATQRGLHNVRFVDPVGLHELTDWIKRASLCLGTFGASEKSGRVVAHKCFEALASRRPLITADTEAARWAFGSDSCLLALATGEGLAKAVDRLMRSPRERSELAEAGHLRYLERFHSSIIGDEFVRVVAAATRPEPHGPGSSGSTSTT